ncbi:hypothetical protein L7F22_013351 [Adiantum nelumboides]|nr:hypothetical protein [Adiantum nelumboides]
METPSCKALGDGGAIKNGSVGVHQMWDVGNIGGGGVTKEVEAEAKVMVLPKLLKDILLLKPCTERYLPDVAKHLEYLFVKRMKSIYEKGKEKDERCFELNAYSRHKSEVQKTDEDWSTSRTFLDCKELASKLSATFSGSARNLYKSSILHIVKEGIEYAFYDAPKQLPFLEGGVLQFALKLPQAEVQEILSDLERRVEGVNTDEDPSSWRPYFTFVDYLREKAFKAPHNDGEKAGSVIRQQPRSRKAGDIQGKKLFEGDETTDDEHLSDSGEKHMGEDDDTPLQNNRRRTRARDAGTSKVHTVDRVSQATDDGALADISVYSNSLYGSATEEQLPV